MKNNLLKHVLKISIIFLLMFSACAEQFSSEFKDNKKYSISDQDKKACLMLSSQLMDVDTTVMDTTRYYQPVQAGYTDTTVAAAWVNATDSAISADFDIMLSDTTVLVDNALLAADSYAIFEKSAGSSLQTYFYLSWDLTLENLSTYITLRIYRKDGTMLKLLSNALDLSSVAGCAEAVDLGNKEEVYPKIRARLEYELEAGQYLVQFTVSKPETVPAFRVVVL